MKPIFNILALLILAYWALGVFAWGLTPIIHFLLPVAVLVVLTGNHYRNGIYR